MTKDELFSMDETKLNEMLVENLQLSIERYIEAEKIIVEYLKANWFQRLFFGNKFFGFICERLIKYKF